MQAIPDGGEQYVFVRRLVPDSVVFLSFTSHNIYPRPIFVCHCLGTAGPPPSVHIYYSDADTLDARHARHLRALPGVQLHELDCEGHRIIPQLKSNGDLLRILNTAMCGP